jgi:ubiquinone/menaquinone biosynthesis C-methylase UbiE
VVDYRKKPIDFQLFREGERIPFDDKSFDYTFIMEVLHHSDDPEHLLKEAVRVTRGSLVIFEDVVTSRSRLLFMYGLDILMNIRHGVNLPLNFRSENVWIQIFQQMNLSIRNIYDYSFYPPQRSRVFVLDVNEVSLPKDPTTALFRE